MLSFNSLIFKPYLACLMTLLMISSFSQITSTSEESIRLRSLMEIIPRFKGRAYSNKLSILYENNQFFCKAADNISPKEFSFLSSTSYSVCSDKIFEGFDLIAKKISEEVDALIEPKLILKINFLNDLKKNLYFAYYLAYLLSPEVKRSDKNETKVADNFYDKKQLSNTQTDLLENLSGYYFNILEYSIEDLKIVNNYLHTIMDFNINNAKQKINNIIENIEKALKANPTYSKWLVGNSEKIKYYLGVVWANAVNLDFE